MAWRYWQATWLALAAAALGCGGERGSSGKISVGDAAPPGENPASGGVVGVSPDAGVDGGAAFTRSLAPTLPEAEIVVDLPYGSEETVEFEVSASLGRLDVVFNVDTTSSMDEEIDLLQRELLSVIVPALQERVDDVAMGVSRFEDFPVRPFGGSTPERADVPFQLLTQVTQDRGTIARAIRSLDSPLGFGGDLPEAGGEALYQLATGSGYKSGGQTYIQPFEPARSGLGTVGGAGFRDRALPVIVHITDAPMHRAEDYAVAFKGVHGRSDEGDALRSIGARVIGIGTGGEDGPASADLRALAIATRSFAEAEDGKCPDSDGAPTGDDSDLCPLVFSTNDQGAGLSDIVADSIISLLDGLRFGQVQAIAATDPNGFVLRVDALLVDQEAGQPDPVVLDLLPPEDPDGVADTFEGVWTRNRLAFAIRLRNDRVKALSQRQTFRVRIQVLGDGLSVQEHVLRVVIPAAEADPASTPLDAGLDTDAAAPDPNSPDAGLPDGRASGADSGL